jgi:hypothetical protein
LESQFLALLKLLGLAVLVALLDFHWRNPNFTQDFAQELGVHALWDQAGQERSHVVEVLLRVAHLAV